MRRFYFLYGGLTMDNKIAAIKEQFLAELSKAENSADLEAIRVAYLGKKGSITELLKGMKDLSVEEKKDFFEGFTPEYIRCYLNSDVICGEIYNVRFKEIYKIEINKDKINDSGTEITAINNVFFK